MESGIIPGDSYEPHSSVIEATRDIREDGAGFQIIAASPSRRVWSLGHDFIVKEWLCPHDYDGAVEARASRLLRDRGVDIPVPAVKMHWKDGDWAFIVSQRLPGRPLSEIWDGLADEDRDRVAKQTADMIAGFRSIESELCSALDGGPVRDVNVQLTSEKSGNGRVRRSFGPLATEDEVWAQIFKPRLDAAGVDEEHQRTLRECMPSPTGGEPGSPSYPFTHGDLAFGNILIEDGDGGMDVSGILDFEFSAYLPAWWEYLAAQFGCCRGDGEWKTLLRHYMEPNEHAVDWFLYWSELCKTPMPEDIDIWPQILAKYVKA